MPEDLRATAKNCSKCHGWFSPERFERVCLACLSQSQRALRASRYNHTGAPKNVTDVAAQRHVRGHSTDLCRELAFELAATQVSAEVVAAYGKLPAMARIDAYRYTKRNVELGLQGACDLDRYR